MVAAVLVVHGLLNEGPELRDALENEYKLSLEDREFEELFRRFDADGNGYITFYEFMAFAMPRKIEDDEDEHMRYKGGFLDNNFHGKGNFASDDDPPMMIDGKFDRHRVVGLV